MMRKIFILLIFALSLSVSSLPASSNINTVWKTDNLSLSIAGNYGTPLGDELRKNHHRKKGYHFYNLLRNKNIKGDFILTLKKDQTGENIYSLNSLDLLKTKDIDPEKAEDFNPVYDNDRLLHERWKGNFIEIISGGNVIYRSSAPLKLIGKKNNNILISEEEVLKYLDEVDWTPVEELEGYSVKPGGWIDSEHIAFFAEDKKTGQKVAGITSVRRPKSYFYGIPSGSFIDIIASKDLQQTYILVKDGKRYKIYSRTPRGRWNKIEDGTEKIYLLGIKKQELLWVIPQNGYIRTEDDKKIEDIKIDFIDSYPSGQYQYGQGLSNMEQIEFKKVKENKILTLFYGSSAAKELEKYGLTGVEKFNSFEKVWFMPESYRKSLENLPEKENLGNLYFAPQDMKIFYDSTGDNYLRDVKTLQLKKDYLFLKCVVLLFIIMAGGLFIASRKNVAGGN
ncbi:MAG: hypothetical protein ACQEQC_05140 [Elusimicrobiota bacterium]